MDPSVWLEWLWRVVGFRADRAPADASSEFQWANAPEPAAVFVLVAVVVFVVVAGMVVSFLYWREINTCPRPVKLTLAGLRLAVLTALFLILLGPSLVYTQNRERQAFILVLRDASQSMNTRDEYRDSSALAAVAEALGKSPDEVRASPPSRVEIVNHLLGPRAEPLLAGLSERGKTRLANFADRFQIVELRRAAAENAGLREGPAAADAPLEGARDGAVAGAADSAPEGSGSAEGRPGAIELPPLVAEGRGTDLHLAIQEALALEPLAAVIVFSDGQHTGKDAPTRAAELAAEQNVPLLVVGLGDPSKPRNLKAASVYARSEAWPNEEFGVEAVLFSQGVEAREVNVQLLRRPVVEGQDAPAEASLVKQERVQTPAGGGRFDAKFTQIEREPGQYIYSVRVEAVEGESNPDDNQAATQAVRVVDRKKIRVLLIAGAPSWDYLNINKLYTRDPTISVSCWLQSLDPGRPQEGSEPITKLPETLVEINQYDLVMMLDPNPNEFDENWLKLLKQFAGDHAGGLLYMAGPKYSAAFLSNSRTQGIKELLPVRFGKDEASEVAALLSTNHQAWPTHVVGYNVDHPVMSFYQDRQTTLARWESLPGIFWSFPAEGAKPTARVLLEHGDPTLRRAEGPRPLLVAGQYAAANVVYVGFNGSWRWRREGRRAEFFDRFWIQMARHLIEGRSTKGQRRGHVQTEREEYEIGEAVPLEARLLDASYLPLSVEEVFAVLQVGDESPRPLVFRKVANRPGYYETAVTARRIGPHVVKVAIPTVEGTPPPPLETVFRVKLPDVETNQVWLNEPLLRDLAATSGGAYYRVNQLKSLVDEVPRRVEKNPIRGKPQPLWDLQGVLFLLVGLLCVEWAARKWFKLL